MGVSKQNVPTQGVAASLYETQSKWIPDFSNVHQAGSIVLVLDHIQDSYNMGAMCRTAECFGIKTIIYPKNRASKLTMSVKKAASGAIEYLHMVEVVNLCRIITTMKTQHGYWVYGTGIKKE